MLRSLLVSAAFPILIFCATAASADNELSSQQAATIAATCSKVMRLEPGQAEFQGCIDTLSDELAGEMRYARAAESYRGCTQDGLKPGTPGLGRCVLDAEDAAQPRTMPAALDPADVKPADDNQGGYFATAFALRHRREEYACAQIALQPASGPFQSCVADLDANIWNIEHPPG